MDELFRESNDDVTLDDLLAIPDVLDQLRRWQLLDFPTLQNLLDFLTRNDIVASMLSTLVKDPMFVPNPVPSKSLPVPPPPSGPPPPLPPAMPPPSPIPGGKADRGGPSPAVAPSPRPGEAMNPNGTVWEPQFEAYRNQYICSRLLCMDPFGGNVVTFMCASVSAYARAWDALLCIFKAPGMQLDPIVSNLFVQVLRQFSQRDFEKLCAQLCDRDAVAGLVYQLGNAPFVEWLLEFLGPTLTPASTALSAALLSRMIAVLRREPTSPYEEDLFANVCIVLCNIADSQDARIDTTMRGYLVGRLMKVDDVAQGIVMALFGEIDRIGRGQSSNCNQSHILPVVTALFHLLECGCCFGRSASERLKHTSSTSLCPLLSRMADQFSLLTSYTSRWRSRAGRLPLYFIQIIDLWHSLVRVECGTFDQAFCDTGTMALAVDLFLSPRSNSTLLARIMDLFETIFARDCSARSGATAAAYDVLQIRLLRECSIADRIVSFFSPDAAALSESARFAETVASETKSTTSEDSMDSQSRPAITVFDVDGHTKSGAPPGGRIPLTSPTRPRRRHSQNEIRFTGKPADNKALALMGDIDGLGPMVPPPVAAGLAAEGLTPGVAAVTGNAAPPMGPIPGRRRSSVAYRHDSDTSSVTGRPVSSVGPPPTIAISRSRCTSSYLVCLANAILHSQCCDLLDGDDSWSGFVDGPLKVINTVWGDSNLPDDDQVSSRGSEGYNLWEMEDEAPVPPPPSAPSAATPSSVTERSAAANRPVPITVPAGVMTSAPVLPPPVRNQPPVTSRLAAPGPAAGGAVVLAPAPSPNPYRTPEKPSGVKSAGAKSSASSTSSITLSTPPRAPSSAGPAVKHHATPAKVPPGGAKTSPLIAEPPPPARATSPLLPEHSNDAFLDEEVMDLGAPSTGDDDSTVKTSVARSRRLGARPDLQVQTSGLRRNSRDTAAAPAPVEDRYVEEDEAVEDLSGVEDTVADEDEHKYGRASARSARPLSPGSDDEVEEDPMIADGGAPAHADAELPVEEDMMVLGY